MIVTPDSSPSAGPAREAAHEMQSYSQTPDFSRVASFTPLGSMTPTPSSRTDIPLLPTNYPVPPVPHIHHERNSKKPLIRRFLTAANEFMLGKEKASVYWYASLLSVLAALIVTGSSIFGWPPLPIWEYLRHVTR